MKKLKIMRKRKFTNYFKIGILFVGISLFLSSCEKDNQNIEPIQEQNSNYLQKKVTINELQNNTKLINKISSIQNKLKSNKLAKGGKKVPSFNIYLKEGTYIEDKTTKFHSYTFPVIYNNLEYQNDTIKNIVLALTHENTYEAFLATYKVTKQERELIANGTSINLSEKLNMTSLNINSVNMFSRSECYWIQKITREEIACIKDQCWDPRYTTWITVSDWDLICVDVGGDSGGTGNSDNSTGNGSNNNVSVPTTPVIDGIEASISRINSAIGPLNFKEKKFLEDNVGVLLSIEDFLFENNSVEAKDFAKEAIEILSFPLIQSSSTSDYVNDLKRMIKHLREWGDPEDEFFADYIESLLPDLYAMSRGDVIDIHKITKDQVDNLTLKFLDATIIPFAEAAYPFVVYAVTEATLGVAIPLISRIPLSMVLRGTRLNKMVRQIAKLGTAGTGSHIRLIPNSTYTKTLNLFNKLTQNAVSVTTETLSNGRIRKIANMGDGNYITFRNFDYSNTPNLTANIDLNFPAIWTKVRELKFIQ